MANLKVTLVKSTIGAVPKHKKTVEALGLKKLNKTVVLPDNAATCIWAIFVFSSPVFKRVTGTVPIHVISFFSISGAYECH